MFANIAEMLDMAKLHVLKEMQHTRIKPKYLQFNCWKDNDAPCSQVADWSTSADPLPSAPILPADHPLAVSVLSHPELFRIVSPVNVKVLETYLMAHPNYEFVESMCRGFHNGFWPWGTIDKESYPLINDESRPMPSDANKASFLKGQCEEEIAKGHFSQAFGHELLPGMYAMPSFAVPKPNSTKMHLNSLTNCHSIAFPMDNMVQLGELLLKMHRSLPAGEHLVLFKSNVAEAYQLIPLHLFWQAKQVNTIDGL
jgi:hypothetical protein